MAPDTAEAVESSTIALRDAEATLVAEENRLASELATVKTKRMAVTKALAALSDDRPKRRRGRPRKADTPATA